MVDVGDKAVTARAAIATARVTMTPETARALAEGSTPKGDVLATARIAGIQAAKRTPELIPLCHAIALTRVQVRFTFAPDGVRIEAEAEARDRTGVEMEAMTAVTVAALTLYDMLKGIDRAMTVTDVRLEEKRGGRSGHWTRAEQGSSARSPAEEPARRFAVVREPIDVEALRRRVAHPSAGATCVFVGTVRDHNEGASVTQLDYEAYESMAVDEMRRCAEEIEREIPGVRLAAIHRAGSLAVGEDAVACAASAPHRAEAFDAARRLIDAIKARAPIWKREHGPDGPRWLHWQDARDTPR
jgi:molybdenum cofactor biosynthesis protein MoaC